ncbi:MAG TPA: hypothetical protein PJ987_09505 [Bacteroidia bacterium]|nr:hypothetical protein [Bacteroidia bacterium]HMY42186.1 hypothetical protein [Chitinophagales bacterium]
MENITTLSFSVNHLNSLKVDRKNNLLLNEEEFLSLIDKDLVLELKSTHDRFCKTLGIEGDFFHSFWTLILNANKENFHGMKYGCLCSTMYMNNSSPNLIEISIALPQYQTILWEPAPKQYKARRCETNEYHKHVTNDVIEVLRQGFMNGVIGDSQNVWQNNWWNGNPFGTKFDDFKVNDPKDKRQKANIKYVFKTIKVKGKTFKSCLVTYNFAKDFHIITIDDRIAFISTNNVACSNAFEILTGVKDVGYDSKKGKRKYETKNKNFESFVETIGGEPSVQNVTIIEPES